MKIAFSAQRSDAVLALARAGDTLIINGEPFDFSGVPEGATLPADAINSPFVAGEVSRTDGEPQLTVLLPHGPNPPRAVAYPDPVTVTADGPVALPGDAS